MGKCRFMHANEINDVDQISVSSVAAGIVGGVFAQQLGAATITVTGTYSGGAGKVIDIEIDSVAAGTEIGQATFKWKNAAGTSWNATGVATSASPVLLADGMYVNWTAATGDDFELGDRWSFPCLAPRGKAKMFDLNRDTMFRFGSLGSPDYITLDLGTATAIKVIILFDHNITSGATITLKANNADSWGAPAYSTVITWVENQILVYLDQTYRYWRLEITDAGNPDGYVEFSNLFLGSYYEPAKNFVAQWTRGRESLDNINETDAGAVEAFVRAQRELFQLQFGQLTHTQAEALFTVFSAVKNVETGKLCPLFFNVDSDYTDRLWLMFMQAKLARRHRAGQYFDVGVDLTERIKTNA